MQVKKQGWKVLNYAHYFMLITIASGNILNDNYCHFRVKTIEHEQSTNKRYDRFKFSHQQMWQNSFLDKVECSLRAKNMFPETAWN